MHKRRTSRLADTMIRARHVLQDNMHSVYTWSGELLFPHVSKANVLKPGPPRLSRQTLLDSKVAISQGGLKGAHWSEVCQSNCCARADGPLIHCTLRSSKNVEYASLHIGKRSLQPFLASCGTRLQRQPGSSALCMHKLSLCHQISETALQGPVHAFISAHVENIPSEADTAVRFIAACDHPTSLTARPCENSPPQPSPDRLPPPPPPPPIKRKWGVLGPNLGHVLSDGIYRAHMRKVQLQPKVFAESCTCSLAAASQEAEALPMPSEVQVSARKRAAHDCKAVAAPVPDPPLLPAGLKGTVPATEQSYDGEVAVTPIKGKQSYPADATASRAAAALPDTPAMHAPLSFADEDSVAAAAAALCLFSPTTSKTHSSGAAHGGLDFDDADSIHNESLAGLPQFLPPGSPAAAVEQRKWAALVHAYKTGEIDESLLISAESGDECADGDSGPCEPVDGDVAGAGMHALAREEASPLELLLLLPFAVLDTEHQRGRAVSLQLIGCAAVLAWVRHACQQAFESNRAAALKTCNEQGLFGKRSRDQTCSKGMQPRRQRQRSV